VKKQVPLTPVLAVGLVILLAVAYMALIRPKSSEAARLDDEIAALESEAVLRRPATAGKPEVEIDYADLFQLAKAMPDNSDMAGILLEVNAVASSAGITFVSIQPLEPIPSTDSTAHPINLTFRGNYYDLTDFLYRLRSLVSVKDGVLDASGRLYTLDGLDMHEAAEEKFPMIEAVLSLTAYSYGVSDAAPVPGAPPAATTDTSSTQTTSTESTSTGETTTEQTSTDPPDQQAAGAGS
jgi:Tfp pilus assembly protein PilO